MEERSWLLAYIHRKLFLNSWTPINEIIRSWPLSEAFRTFIHNSYIRLITNSQQVDKIFINFSKAFDTVSHSEVNTWTKVSWEQKTQKNLELGTTSYTNSVVHGGSQLSTLRTLAVGFVYFIAQYCVSVWINGPYKNWCPHLSFGYRRISED